jgi:hypothetical protein
LQFCYKARDINNCINFKRKFPYQVRRVFIFTNAYQSVSEELCIALTDHFFARGSSPDLTEGKKNLNFKFFFGANKDLEDLSAYAGGVAE